MHPFAPTQLTPCFLYFVAIHTLPIFFSPYTMSQKNKLKQCHKMVIDQVYDEAKGYHLQ